jgi:hypothetical protein
VNIACVVHSGEFTPVVATMLASLDRHCDCTLIFVAQGMTAALQQHVRSVFEQPIEFRAVPDEQWFGQRMARKIWEVQHVSFGDGDRVFVLDTDLLVQADIFAGLDGSFDVGLTTRHYDYWYKINGGVWGFQFNARSRAFLKFFADEIRCPTWAPFVAFQESFKLRRPPSAHRSLDWWCDQDFLCTVFDHPLPFACTIGDLGPRYNFCPSVEDDIPGTFEKARAEISAKLGDRDIKVLHFKGRLKEVLAELRHVV